MASGTTNLIKRSSSPKEVLPRQTDLWGAHRRWPEIRESSGCLAETFPVSLRGRIGCALPARVRNGNRTTSDGRGSDAGLRGRRCRTGNRDDPGGARSPETLPGARTTLPDRRVRSATASRNEANEPDLMLFRRAVRMVDHVRRADRRPRKGGSAETSYAHASTSRISTAYGAPVSGRYT